MFDTAEVTGSRWFRNDSGSTMGARAGVQSLSIVCVWHFLGYPYGLELRLSRICTSTEGEVQTRTASCMKGSVIGPTIMRSICVVVLH